jgi:hypothetical protein
MKITVQRSGGIAALPRVWSVQANTPTDKSRWQPIVEACPWDAVPGPADFGGQADRFMYSIRAGQRRATLPEQAVTGPWRVLVDHTKAEAEAARNGERRSGGTAGTAGTADPKAAEPRDQREAQPRAQREIR